MPLSPNLRFGLNDAYNLLYVHPDEFSKHLFSHSSCLPLFHEGTTVEFCVGFLPSMFGFTLSQLNMFVLQPESFTTKLYYPSAFWFLGGTPLPLPHFSIYYSMSISRPEHHTANLSIISIYHSEQSCTPTF